MSFGLAQAKPVESGVSIVQQTFLQELQVNTAGILNFDERGATSNVILDFYVGAGALITSLGWDVNVTSYEGSYLSEMQLTFSDTLGNGVTFTPGYGDDFDGTADYAGFQDLAELGQVFAAGADGILRLEFHDGFKDLAFDEPEGIWNTGTLTFGIAPVPEPSGVAMLLGGLLLLSAARKWRPAAFVAASAFLAGPAFAEATFEVAKPIPLYSYYVTGDANAAVTAPSALPTPSFVLMGGGPDVDPAFRWLIQRAGIKPGTGGRFVVIRATGTEAYNPYIFYSDENLSTSSTIADLWVGGASLGLTSVETLVIPSVKAANSEAVNAIVAKANVVFIAGGDQSHYIRFWKGTALEQTLNTLMGKNVPVGGTSAGLAVLGQFDYSALYKSATSESAMLDPYYKDITFDPAPLSLQGGFIAPPALASMIFDSHLDERDRMGRFITFISRIVAPTATPGGTFGCAGGVLPASSSGSMTARGIGIGVETALLVQGNGSGKPVTAKRITNVSTTTESAVYFVRPSVPPSVCKPRTPLSAPTVEVRKLADSNGVFNITEWTGVPVYKYLDVTSGSLFPADWY
jgi:cyanophycinase-like exopeptidase